MRSVKRDVTEEAPPRNQENKELSLAIQPIDFAFQPEAQQLVDSLSRRISRRVSVAASENPRCAHRSRLSTRHFS